MKKKLAEHFPDQAVNPNVVIFPAAINRREIDRAARALIAGRSPTIQNWIKKRAGELRRAGVSRDDAMSEIEWFVAAIYQRMGDLGERHA